MIMTEFIHDGSVAVTEITGYTHYSGEAQSYFLSRGDRIAVISPSSLPTREQADATVDGLRSWGFVAVEGRSVCPETRTLKDCAEDLRWALEAPEIRGIFCVRGGYGATEVTDVIPKDIIAAARKPIIGYSDITAFHSAWTSVGLPSIHASMSGAFMGLPGECAEAERRMMMGEIPSYQCTADEFCRKGTARGTLIGGNLSTMIATLETSCDCTKTDQPYILFFEDVGENIVHIHRYLTILRNHGILDRARGIIFGEWTELPGDEADCYGASRGGEFASVEDMISRQLLKDRDLPIAFGFPAGHGDLNYPLLMGAEAELSVEEARYRITWGVNH